jgi:hypothetical protein
MGYFFFHFEAFRGADVRSRYHGLRHSERATLGFLFCCVVCSFWSDSRHEDRRAFDFHDGILQATPVVGK